MTPPSQSGQVREKRRGGRRSAPDDAQAPPDFGEARDPSDPEWQRRFFESQRLAEARIPIRFRNKTLDNFNARSVVCRRLVESARNYITGFNLDDKKPLQGLYMAGGVGSGKSHMAAAILREVIAKGYSGLFYNSPDLLTEIRASFNKDAELTESVILDEVAQVDLLVLDDLGAETVKDWVLDRFYLIINKRYELCKPMIVTTNFERGVLRERLGDRGDRILSRLAEMCQVFGPFPEEDYRRRMLQD